MDRAGFLRLMLAGAASAALPGALKAAAGEYDFFFTRLMYESGDWDVDKRMPANIITALIDYTTLRVDPKEHVIALSDPAMLLAPFCYLAGHKLVQFSAAESRIFSSFFSFDGPPTTGFELNGWGDDLVHDYLKGISINGRLGVLYSNKDYGCEWDYDWRNKRFLAEDNTKFAINIVMYALNA